MYRASEIIKEVKRLKREYPKCVYSNGLKACTYSSGTCKNGPKTKGCIIGQAIRNIYPVLFRIIASPHEKYNNCRISDIIYGCDIKCTENQLDLLTKYQKNQDDNMEWGVI